MSQRNQIGSEYDDDGLEIKIGDWRMVIGDWVLKFWIGDLEF